MIGTCRALLVVVVGLHFSSTTGFDHAAAANTADAEEIAASSSSVTGRLASGSRGLRGARQGMPFFKKKSPSFFTFCNIIGDELGLINTLTEEIILVPFNEIEGWPYPEASSNTQHAAASPDLKTIYVGTVANGLADDLTSNAAIVAIEYDGIDWNEGEVKGLNVTNVVVTAVAGTASDYPYPPISGSDEQPIASWTSPAYAQLHGPTFRPNSPYMYWGTWTGNGMIALNTDTNTLEEIYKFPGISDFTHGYFFNDAGTLALGAQYFYDGDYVALYSFPNKGGPQGGPNPAEQTSEPQNGAEGDIVKIPLLDGGKYGAFSHYVYWYDDRYAYVSTMQFGNTSLTDQDKEIDGPGIYLIDTKELTSTRVAGTASSKDEGGVWHSASDTVIANGKLYVSEEDTLDGSFGSESGSVAIFGIHNDMSLTFINRLYSGKRGVPEDFGVAHGSAVTVDENYVLVSSYTSNHILKIDTDNDEVVKVWNATDGLSAPHGGFIAGRNR